jgi:hypothetical protein
LDLRAAVPRLASLCSLASRSGEERKQEFEALMRHETAVDEGRKKRVDDILKPKFLDSLKDRLLDPDESWRESILQIHRDWEKSLGEDIKIWRKSRRRKPTHTYGQRIKEEFKPLGGISYWAIEELTDTRKLFISWSTRSIVRRNC